MTQNKSAGRFLLGCLVSCALLGGCEESGGGHASFADTESGDPGPTDGEDDSGGATDDDPAGTDDDTGSAGDTEGSDGTASDSTADTGSASDDDGSESASDVCVDEDGDGWCLGLDCNDTDSTIQPDQEEATDNFVDDDCDGATDEDDDAEPDTALEQDCSACPAVGNTIAHLACAVELCDPAVLLDQSYESPSAADTAGTYTAVTRFGNLTNDLAPLGNGSYALIATGPAAGTNHDVSQGGNSIADPFSSDGYDVNDVMEWRLHLKAPAEAHGFAVNYVFFSEEYDEYVDSTFNDKFYIFIEAPSTNGGARTVINFTSCRRPNAYHDFVCDAATMDYCTDGERYCYIAINTSLSECCWYNGCPFGTATTKIGGTGFGCATGEFTDSSSKGSSTGWLVTEWAVEPNEEFDLIFHIHDTSDHAYDSEVILDNFLFKTAVDPGTHIE